MIQIPLSQAGSAEAFAAEAESHRTAIEQHQLGAPGISAPAHNELIESLIVRTQDTGPVAKRKPDKITIAPYEIVDDTAPPPTLDQRKAELVGKVNEAAQKALNAVLSPARQRLLSLDIGPAMAVDEPKRTAAQKATVDQWTSFSASAAAINRTVAEACVEIEDLADATIDAWKVPAF